MTKEQKQYKLLIKADLKLVADNYLNDKIKRVYDETVKWLET